MPGRGFRVPPGRAGRLWLQRRLVLARRGADLLDRKLVILRGELDQLRVAAGQASAQWARCQAEADRWLLRVALLGGQRAVRLAADGRLAEVTVEYSAVMGIRYPASASCVCPEPGGGDGPVLAAARRAQQAALTAAVRHAAAAQALAVVEAEVLATRYRLRAIRDRWIPRMEQALAEVSLGIEEQEIADAARLRLAAGRGRGRTGP
jgi:V/A-type H+/Na+-transporting ATPase subunit D